MRGGEKNPLHHLFSSFPLLPPMTMGWIAQAEANSPVLARIEASRVKCGGETEEESRWERGISSGACLGFINALIE